MATNVPVGEEESEAVAAALSDEDLCKVAAEWANRRGEMIDLPPWESAVVRQLVRRLKAVQTAGKPG